MCLLCVDAWRIGCALTQLWRSMGGSRARHVSAVVVCVLQILYYDGQFDDARLNVALATTAAAAGAAVANYVEATQLIRVGYEAHSTGLCVTKEPSFV